MAINPGFIFLGAAALLAVAFLRYQRRSASGSFVRPDDPMWAEAVARARATGATMRTLHEQGVEVWIKYACQPEGGEREHVWGRLLELTDQYMRVTLETPLRQRRAGAPGPQESAVPLSELEDWQAELSDGTIAGGYTTRAEIEIARREKRALPPHIAAMAGRFQKD